MLDEPTLNPPRRKLRAGPPTDGAVAGRPAARRGGSPRRARAGRDAPMRVRLRRQPGGAMVVHVRGEIDEAAAAALRDCVHEHVCLLYDPLVLDLTAVHLLDTAGVAALVQAAQATHRAGVELRVVADHHAVTRPLRSAAVLNVFPTLAAALGAAAPSPVLGPAGDGFAAVCSSGPRRAADRPAADLPRGPMVAPDTGNSGTGGTHA